ncbi:N-formylglutamate amidohydrolase [Billgrantia endophytica]|uniref:N-formylglutamate amidohydrolase n=1 Tax=Billgrantia endophytica TaxID=2033802 RepID=A0A2N7UAE4_9GAMM|nr:N-formylglutamate amidohydrolase [Halomonas endophytica]PMR77417.1 N-formylglutamate amidohydrolase [Halomonas endophytica]
MRLLAEDELPPVTVHRQSGKSIFVLASDHAGNSVPRRLRNLGLPQSELGRHIGIDVGILETSLQLADQLDAPLIAQRYSRLVIDCNRQPGNVSSMPTISESTEVPGNCGLSDDEMWWREREIFHPYHDMIKEMLDSRDQEGRDTVLVAMHSFTPELFGRPRPWHIGVLFNRDPRVGKALLELLRAEGDLCVGENEPYAVDDENDYTIPVHGERRGLPHVEIEIRQDQLADAGGRKAWADRLARLLPQAVDRALTPTTFHR